MKKKSLLICLFLVIGQQSFAQEAPIGWLEYAKNKFYELPWYKIGLGAATVGATCVGAYCAYKLNKGMPKTPSTTRRASDLSFEKTQEIIDNYFTEAEQTLLSKDTHTLTLFVRPTNCTLAYTKKPLHGTLTTLGSGVLSKDACENAQEYLTEKIRAAKIFTRSTIKNGVEYSAGENFKIRITYQGTSSATGQGTKQTKQPPRNSTTAEEKEEISRAKKIIDNYFKPSKHEKYPLDLTLFNDGYGRLIHLHSTHAVPGIYFRNKHTYETLKDYLTSKIGSDGDGPFKENPLSKDGFSGTEYTKNNLKITITKEQ